MVIIYFQGPRLPWLCWIKSTSPIYRCDTSLNGYLLAEVFDHLHSQFMLPSGKFTVRPWKSLIFSGNQNLPTEPLSARVYVNVLEIMGGWKKKTSAVITSIHPAPSSGPRWCIGQAFQAPISPPRHHGWTGLRSIHDGWMIWSTLMT